MQFKEFEHLDRHSDPTTSIVNGFNHDRFLEQMISLVPGILYVFNHQNQSNEFANRSIADLLGYSQEAIHEMGDALLATVIHPDDLASIGAYFASLNGLDLGQTSTFEYRAVNESGDTVWLRSHDAIFDRDESGDVLRHIGIANDITSEKATAFQLLELNNCCFALRADPVAP